MTSTYAESTSVPVAAAAYGGLAGAIGGAATIILAIVALRGVHVGAISSIAVIVFGTTLSIHGGTVLSEYEAAMLPVGAASASSEQFGVGGLSTLFVVGAAGIVLGILALVGIATETLTAVSVIAFGSALLLSSNSLRHLSLVQTSPSRSGASRSGVELLSEEMASGSAGLQMLVGLAAIVLGIVAVAINQNMLVPAALIVLGATVILSGTALAGLVIGFTQMTTRSRSVRP